MQISKISPRSSESVIEINEELRVLAASDRAAGRKSYLGFHGDGGILAISCLIAVVSSFWFYSGFYASDDMTYLESIRLIATGQKVDPELASLRFPLLLPAALIYTLSSGNVAVTIGSFIIYHPLLVLVVFFLTRLVHCSRSAALAALIVAVQPLLYAFTGSILPDPALACWTSLWCLTFLVGLKRFRSSAAVNPRLLSYFLLAGVIQGIAYLTKESGLVLAVPAFVSIALLLRTYSLKQIFPIGFVYSLGLVFVLIAEVALVHAFTGQAIVRLGIISNDLYTQHLNQIILTQGSDLFSRLSFAYKIIWPFFGTPGLLVVGLVLVFYPYLKQAEHFLWITAIWLVLFHILGTTSFTSYVPPPIVNRYFSIALVPLAPMAGYAMLCLCRSVTSIFTRRGLLFGDSLAIALIISWGVSLLLAHLPSAGMIYRAPQVKSFFSAYVYAKESYRDLPLVLSPYTSFRMHPLFPCPVEDFWLMKRTECLKAGYPTASFVYLAALPQFEKIFPDMFEDTFRSTTYQRTLLKTFRAPASRWEELLPGLANLLYLRKAPSFTGPTRWNYHLFLAEPVDSRPTDSGSK